MFASISLVLRVLWGSTKMCPGGAADTGVCNVAEEPTPEETSNLIKGRGGGRRRDLANLSKLCPE